MPRFLENKTCTPCCSFVVQILRVAGPFMCSCIPGSCLQITSDNVYSCKYSRQSCRLTLIQDEDQYTHHPPSRNGSSILKALLALDPKGKTIHLSQDKMLFSSSAITAITFSICLIRGTIAEPIAQPELLIKVAIAAGAIPLILCMALGQGNPGTSPHPQRKHLIFVIRTSTASYKTTIGENVRINKIDVGITILQR